MRKLKKVIIICITFLMLGNCLTVAAQEKKTVEMKKDMIVQIENKENISQNIIEQIVAGVFHIRTRVVTCCDNMRKQELVYTIHSLNEEMTICTVSTYRMVYCTNCDTILEPPVVISSYTHYHPDL